MTSSTVSNSPLALSRRRFGMGERPATFRSFELARKEWSFRRDGVPRRGGIGALITRIARRYTLPPKCAITHDDLVQEGCLGYLEAQITHPEADEKKLLNYARKAMQRAMTRYISPVTHSLDTVLYTDDAGNPITFADTIADTPTDADSNLSLAHSTLLRADGERVPDLSGEIGAFLSSLDAAFAAGSITSSNYRQKKHRFLKKLRRQVSQNRDSPV